MTESPNLEALYQEARASFKAGDYDRASGLLRQILVEDENFKDTARLLAQMVRLQRRRWYNDLRLYAAVGFIALILLVIWLAPRLRDFYAAPVLLANTATPFTIIPPTLTAAITAAPTLPPASTPVPLAWKRLNMAQDLPKDTVTAIAIHPKDSDEIYLGMQNAGLFKSIDGGSSWQPIQNGLPRGYVLDILVDPEVPDIVYVALADAGLYRTDNGGKDWKAINNGIVIPTGTWFGNFSMDSSDRNHIFFFSYWNGIYETKNGGGNWSMIKDGEGIGIKEGAFSPKDANTLFFVSEGEGLQKSSDLGKTWEFIGPVKHVQGGRHLWIEPVKGETIYISLDVSDAVGESTYISTDGGSSWRMLGITCQAMAFVPHEEKQAYCAADQHYIYKTMDGGQTWQTIASTEGGGQNLAIAPSDPNIIYYGTENNLYVSKDGGSAWSSQTSGLGAGWFEIKVDLENPFEPIIKTFSQDKLQSVYHSSDTGHSWQLILKDSPGFAVDASRSTAYRFQGFDPSVLSPTIGWKWNDIPFPAQPWGVGLFADPKQTGLLYLASTNDNNIPITYSQDGGATWTSTNTVLNCSYPLISFDKDRVYASDNCVLKFAFASNLKEWIDCANPFNADISRSESRFAFDPRDGAHMLAATWGAGLWTSHDGCQTWNVGGDSLDNKYVNSVAFDPSSPGTIYAGTDGGAYVSFDDSHTWGKINDGLLGAYVVYSLAVNKDGNVFATTPYGVFQLEHE